MTPLAWAVAAIVDVFIIDRGVYRNPNQAAAISGMVVAIPFSLIALSAWDPASLDSTSVVLGLGGGLCDLLMLWFYYKALFTTNDVTHAETFFNLEVLFIPMLAFIFIGEQLSSENFLGVGLAVIGVLILNRCAERYTSRGARMAGYLLAAVLASSSSLVIQDMVFARTSYWNGIGNYAIGIMLGVLLLARCYGPLRGVKTFWRNHGVILAAEVFTLIATFTSLRAIDLSPSVSLVAVIESTRPMLIMLACLLGWAVLRQIRLCGAEEIQALRDQFDVAPAKLAANGFIIGGVYIVSSTALTS